MRAAEVNNMTTDSFTDKLEAYVLGLLSEPEFQQVQKHVQTCADCRQEIGRLQNAAHLIERGFNQEPPSYLRSKVLANLKDSRQPKRNWLAWVAPGLVAAAVLVLIIKIEPGRIAKEQARVSPVQEQKRAELAPAPQPAEKNLESRPARPAEALKKQRRAASSVPALLNELAQDDRERPAGPGDVKKRALAEESFAEETKFEAAAPAGEVSSAVSAKSAEREEAPSPVPAGLAGSARVLSAAAPARSAAKAVRRDDSRNASAQAQEDEMLVPAKELSCIVTLAGTEGRLDPTQVLTQIGRFAGQVKESILRQGEARTVMLKVALDAQGKITFADYANGAFKSADLNQFIVGKIRSLSFPQPADSSPAALLIKIEVK
jgi:hypothetical protein